MWRLTVQLNSTGVDQQVQRHRGDISPMRYILTKFSSQGWIVNSNAFSHSQDECWIWVNGVG